MTIFRYFDKIKRITFGCWGSSSRGAVALVTRRARKFLAPRSAGDTALIFEDIWRPTEGIKPFSAEVKSQHLQSPILSRKINPTVKYRYYTEFVFKNVLFWKLIALLDLINSLLFYRLFRILSRISNFIDDFELYRWILFD